MKKKRKVHYAYEFICNIACGVHFKITCLYCGSPLPDKKLPDATFNKREVTCKRCRKTKIYKSKKSYRK